MPSGLKPAAKSPSGSSLDLAKQAVKSAAVWALGAIVTSFGGPLILIAPFVLAYAILKAARAGSAAHRAWQDSEEGSGAGLWFALSVIVFLANLAPLLFVVGVLLWMSSGGLPY